MEKRVIVKKVRCKVSNEKRAKGTGIKVNRLVKMPWPQLPAVQIQSKPKSSTAQCVR